MALDYPTNYLKTSMKNTGMFSFSVYKKYLSGD